MYPRFLRSSCLISDCCSAKSLTLLVLGLAVTGPCLASTTGSGGTIADAAPAAASRPSLVDWRTTVGGWQVSADRIERVTGRATDAPVVGRVTGLSIGLGPFRLALPPLDLGRSAVLLDKPADVLIDWPGSSQRLTWSVDQATSTTDCDPQARCHLRLSMLSNNPDFFGYPLTTATAELTLDYTHASAQAHRDPDQIFTAVRGEVAMVSSSRGGGTIRFDSHGAASSGLHVRLAFRSRGLMDMTLQAMAHCSSLAAADQLYRDLAAMDVFQYSQEGASGAFTTDGKTLTWHTSTHETVIRPCQ